MKQLTNDERIILLDTLVIDALMSRVSKLTGENIEYIQWSVVDCAARHSASMSDGEITDLIASIREDHQIAWNNAVGELIVAQLVNEVAVIFNKARSRLEHLTNDERIILMNASVIGYLIDRLNSSSKMPTDQIASAANRWAITSTLLMTDLQMNQTIEKIRSDYEIGWSNAAEEYNQRRINKNRF